MVPCVPGPPSSGIAPCASPVSRAGRVTPAKIGSIQGRGNPCMSGVHRTRPRSRPVCLVPRRSQPVAGLSGVRGTLLRVLTVEPAGAGDPTRRCRGMTTETAPRPTATATAPVMTCRLCGSTAPAQLPRPRRHAAVRAVPHRRGRRGAGAHLPAARAGVRPLPAGPDPAADHARGDLHRVRLLLLLLDLLGRARAAVRRRRGRAARAGPRLVRGRGRQQRRLPAAARRRAGHPVPGRRAVGERRRGGPREGRADAHRVPHARRPAPQVRAEHGPADLVALNNVYAHIPDVVGFTEGLRALVADDGWVSIEVQHLLTLVRAHPVRHDLPRALPVLHGAHGPAGARVGRASRWSTSSCCPPTAARSGCGRVRPRSPASRRQAVARRARRGAGGRTAHRRGARRVRRRRCPGCATTWSRFLIDARRAGKTVVGYGAPGKGNTLLNYCGIRPDLLAYTVDRNPYKHGRFTPGTRIPILAPERDRRRPARLRAGPAVEPARPS